MHTMNRDVGKSLMDQEAESRDPDSVSFWKLKPYANEAKRHQVNPTSHYPPLHNFFILIDTWVAIYEKQQYSTPFIEGHEIYHSHIGY